jgi:multidrug efflux system outer membrane protein
MTRFLTLLLVLTAHLAAAQPAEPLTVYDALRLVRGAHPAAAAAEMQARAAEAEARGLTSWSAPTLSYAMEGIGTAGGFAEQRLVAGVDVAPAALARAHRTRLTAEREALLLDADATRQALRAAVVAAFVRLGAADSLVAIRRAGLDLADGLVRVARLREQAGEAAGIETLRAELERETAAAALAEATARRSVAAAEALAATGQTVGTRAVRAPRLAVPVGLDGAAQPAWAASAVLPADSLPALAAAGRRIRAAEAAADAVRAERLPVLTGEVFPQHFGRTSFGLGFQVGVRVPLFQRSALDARAQAAQALVGAAAADRDWLATAQHLSAVSAQARVVAARDALAAVQGGPRAQADSLLALSMRGYHLGEVTQAVLLDTLRIRLAVQERALEALRDLLLAMADWERATGASLLFP